MVFIKTVSDYIFFWEDTEPPASIDPSPTSSLLNLSHVCWAVNIPQIIIYINRYILTTNNKLIQHGYSTEENLLQEISLTSF